MKTLTRTLFLLLLVAACGGPLDTEDMNHNDDAVPSRAQRSPRAGGGLVPDYNVQENAVLTYGLGPTPRNGDFENYAYGHGQPPDHWSTASWGTNLESFTTDSLSGPSSLRFKPIAGSTTIQSDPFPVIAGRSYTVTTSWKVRATGNSVFDDKAEIDINFFDASGANTGLNLKTFSAFLFFGATPSAWQTNSMGAATVPPNSATAVITISKGISATLDMLFDAVVYRESTVQPDWVSSGGLNGWVDWGAPYAPTGYMLDTLGFTNLRGTKKSGTVGLKMFTLPPTLCPGVRKIFIVDSNNAFGEVIIETTGDVVLSIGNNAFVSLDGIRFQAGQ